ncbi:MAG: hypothetical protein K2K35_06915 [Lachnospiraceae bacterium]|nr:hypothetical protein [Lachnospiraceae bacterium]
MSTYSRIGGYECSGFHPVYAGWKLFYFTGNFACSILTSLSKPFKMQAFEAAVGL